MNFTGAGEPKTLFTYCHTNLTFTRTQNDNFSWYCFVITCHGDVIHLIWIVLFTKSRCTSLTHERTRHVIDEWNTHDMLKTNLNHVQHHTLTRSGHTGNKPDVSRTGRIMSRPEQDEKRRIRWRGVETSKPNGPQDPREEDVNRGKQKGEDRKNAPENSQLRLRAKVSSFFRTHRSYDSS